MPLAKGEAPWIWFSSSCRFAIKIGFGDCDVLSSAACGPTLERFSRNYLVIPEPSLDEEGEVVRQLINMPCENIHFEAKQLQSRLRALNPTTDIKAVLSRGQSKIFL